MIRRSVSLKEHNTFRVQATAKRFAIFRSTKELESILRQRNDDRLLVIGGGSNILVTEDFDGLVVKNQIKGHEIVEESDTWVRVRVGAGEVWHHFVLKCIDRGLGGVELLSLIPGSVGASPVQNIGAYGMELKDVFVELEAYHIESGEIRRFHKDECEFGYRDSVFKRALKNQFIITSVTFQLTKKHDINSTNDAVQNELRLRGISTPTIKDISDAVIAIRTRKFPDVQKLGNAGCFFTNPVVDRSDVRRITEKFGEFPHYPVSNGKMKLAAGWLIDKAGWKGRIFEGCGVSEKHALFLVNHADSTGSAIIELSERIIADVKLKFGVTLEREVNVI